MKAYAPNGKAIVGTFEVVHGRADIIDDSFEKVVERGRGVTDKLRFEYDGHTEIWWDEQRTVLAKNKERLFVDEDGDLCRESQITLRKE